MPPRWQQGGENILIRVRTTVSNKKTDAKQSSQISVRGANKNNLSTCKASSSGNKNVKY